ncbi:hypothetical protein [Methanobrevibacter sp.]|uniref:hypothetical protein n=1 Tax=Methanobrevibacter sp. TaxID=66852 RepID=UPI00388D13B6
MSYQNVSQRYINRLFYNSDRNFKYLDNLIHSSDGKVVLKSDIVLDDVECERYARGIEFKGDVLHIDGAGHTIDARCKAAIFDFNGTDIIIENTIFKNGHERENHVDTLSNEGSMSLLNCRFLNNYSVVCNDGDMVVRDCIFKGNFDDLAGGAIAHFEGNLEVHNSLFKDNSSSIGGAIYSDGRAVISRCTFKENHSQHRPGAIYAEGEMIIRECDFKNNFSEEGAGAIYNWEESDLTAVDSIFEKNHAEYAGGAIVNDGNLSIRQCKFNENSAGTFGGAIHNSSNLEISQSGFSANVSVANGGAIYNNDGVLEILRSSFSGNRGGIGEAICVSRSDVFKLDESDLNDDCVGYQEDYRF